MSSEYFPTLGVAPHRGRLAIPPDADAEQAVAVISHSLWQRRFGGSESVVGQEVTVSGHPLTIVGVAPPRFSGVWVGAPVDIWLPLSLQHAVHYRQNLSASGTFHLDRPWAPQPAIRWLTIVTRIGPGGWEALQAALDAGAQHHFASIDAGVQTADGSTPAPRRLELMDFQNGFSSVRQQYGQALWMLMGMAAVVLLVTCANIANLLLARATARQREVAVRLSLGAGRMRLIRQMLTESLLLSALGGAAGLLVAYWTNRTLVGLALGEAGLPSEPVLAALALDARVLVFAVALSALTGILFGTVPALRATRFELNAVLKSAGGPLTGRSSRRVMKPLVALQVGLSVVLVAGALLFGRSLYNLYRVDVGFHPHHHLSVVVDTRMAGYADLRLSALYERLTMRLDALPEVTAVSAAMLGLMANNTVAGGAYWFPGSDGMPVESIPENRVGPRFFEAAGMRLVAGRDIGDRDTAGSPAVAVINTALARQHFGSETPVGQHFSRQIGSGATEFEVVGVVADARTQGLRHAPRPMVYYPMAQGTPPPNAELIVRTSGDPARLIAAVRGAIAEVDPHLSVMEMATAGDRMRASLRQDRLVAFLTLAFGLLALALASLGIYGVLSYLVTRRTAELAIRKALGAPRGHIITLLLVAGGAAYLPAQRAWRIDPQLALRYE